MDEPRTKKGPRLALDSSGGVHQPPRLQATAASARPSGGLSPVFNHSAGPQSGPAPALVIDHQRLASNQQRLIAKLNAKLSKPAPAPAPSPIGNVNRTINTERDRLIAQTLKALSATYSKRREEVKQPPIFRLGQPNQITNAFNRSSGFRR
ncbi:hypothetical protein [Rhodopirellula bahusiensis]|uniref:hypothetical protein n=1 Tax=Rhodopirellula bahusiensis TaxID=2014065 RepID=UPI0032630CE2